MIALFTFWDLSQVDTGTMKAEHKVWKLEGCILFLKMRKKEKGPNVGGYRSRKHQRVGGREEYMLSKYIVNLFNKNQLILNKQTKIMEIN